MKQAFLIEPPKYDLLWLYRNYEVKFIYSKRESIDLKDSPEALFEDIYEWAKDNFDPYEDYFVLTGNLVQIVIAVLAIREAHEGKPLKLLRYDMRKKRYIEIGGFNHDSHYANSEKGSGNL